MVTNPEQWIDDFAKAGASSITFHIEANENPEECKRLIQSIKQANMKVGISVKPKTSIDAILPYCNEIDLILIMTVEPGFGGQSFQPEMISKISTLRQKFPHLIIEVDGGINESTALECAKAGANAFVAGNAIFGAPDPKQALVNIRRSGETGMKEWEA
jgi:ribulose-phosphate 3-epimerase